ncbi:MurR/RpiR family transcriptional regulator [Mycetocola spongiae]|uniref:MurR/RpiR family transcriptional regulator n=1 Tax=Mycetocola spongiae TaxID=2859226 RepID=UPI001CF2FADA|nr:MurR/RpiR family transcriptional regulator [Mycetocola spongiae]UCR88676.1 MurR/RpiR family transcriptional regulator [Mycetocola spongiae]
MSVNPLVALQQAHPRLTAAETRVADVIIDRPQLVVESTITELARACHTSPATVARFCQSLGYGGYRDFRIEVAAAMSRDQADREHSQVTTGDIDPEDSAQDVVAKIQFLETQAISQTLRSLDLTVVDAAVAAIIAADRLEIIGFGSSSLSAQDLNTKLSRIGRIAHQHSDVHLGLAQVALLGPGSVAFGISHSGLTVETIHLLQIAREGGATTIGLTNDPESPLAEHCDFLLTTQARESHFRSGATSSRIAQLAVIDVLFVRVAQLLFDSMNDSLRRTYDAVQWHRVRGDRPRGN